MLADEHPAVTDFRDQLAGIYNDLGYLLLSMGKLSEAESKVRRAIAESQKLADEHPAATEFRLRLATSQNSLCYILFRAGKPREADAETVRALRVYEGLPSHSGVICFEMACCRATLAGLATQPGSGGSAVVASSEAAAAMALLQKAVAMGFRNADILRAEPALYPLRGRDDFRLLMMDLAMPASAFAH